MSAITALLPIALTIKGLTNNMLLNHELGMQH